jgi:hypothetical protein
MLFPTPTFSSYPSSYTKRDDTTTKSRKCDNDKYLYMDGKDAMVKEITNKALKYLADNNGR